MYPYFFDSEAMMCVSHNKIYNSKLRYISLRRSLMFKRICNKWKSMGDPLTKVLNRSVVQIYREGMGLYSYTKHKYMGTQLLS